MIQKLYETKHKNKTLDKVNEYINNTIDEYIDDDIYFKLVPILSKSDDVDETNEFFKSYNITPKSGLNSEEYKTISYLALFYKEKIKYNVKDIEKYFKFLGYEIDDDFMTILCLEKNSEYNCNINNYISFEEYLTLEDKQKVKNEVNEKIFNYIDGFDRLFDKGDMK